jgi:hypothetical protein
VGGCGPDSTCLRTAHGGPSLYYEVIYVNFELRRDPPVRKLEEEDLMNNPV